MSNKKGFTLMELLVVVLILGILSSIALPMYQKAVEKSRAAEAFTILDAMSKATYSYMMTEPHGLPPSKFAELTVTPPKGWTGSTKWLPDTDDTLSNDKWSLQLKQGSTDGENGQSIPAAYITVGRIGGNYKGAGFLRVVTAEKEGRLICAEHHVDEGEGMYMVNMETGEYCRKLWDGELMLQDNGGLNGVQIAAWPICFGPNCDF